MQQFESRFLSRFSQSVHSCEMSIVKTNTRTRRRSLHIRTDNSI